MTSMIPLIWKDQNCPADINVLTILTYIGCAIGLLGGIYSFISSEKSYKTLEELQASGKMDEMPGFMEEFCWS